MLAVAASAAALSPEQARLVESARAAALHYSDWLPNLICTERVERAVDWQGAGLWARADKLELEVTYGRAGETYKILSRAGRPAKMNFDNVAGAISKGEFGSALRWIFEPSANASFDYAGRDRIRHQSVEFFDYKVPRPSSRLELRALSKSVIAGFHGRVAIDPEMNLVLRLTLVADAPADFPVTESYVEIDYDWTAIAGKRYLVPVRAETGMTERHPADPMAGVARDRIYAPQSCTGCEAPVQPVAAPARVTRYRNRMEFGDYREFKTESTLTFDTKDEKKF